ncbi:MAG: WbqC family protein [Rikenellaceae bacterium]
MTILPTAYLPSIEYFARLIYDDDARIDLGENYVKRSLRNRAQIMTAAGVMELSVNVRNANRPRMAISTVEIDYTKRWQHQHWLAIVSAYKSSPFFDHYAPFFEPIFSAQYERLVDLNFAIIKLVIKLLGVKIDLDVKISNEYITAHDGDIDLRPRRRNEAGSHSFEHEPYIQVFYDRQEFVPNLSILDLLFNEGTNSVAVLEASRR